MHSEGLTLTVAQVGFTGSDNDRERLLAMALWLERNDPDFAISLRSARPEGKLVEDCYNLNSAAPRDFLAESVPADIVILHKLWGLPGGTESTGQSPLHDAGRWSRRLASTGARHIFVFGGDFQTEPTGYERIDEPSLYYLTVWTKAEIRRSAPITLADVTTARLARLQDFAANEMLDLSHISAIACDQLATIAGMPNLRYLLLSGAPAPDAEIAAMLRSGCSRLQRLYLDQTSVGSASLHALSSCTELRLLSLNDTSVGGAGLGHLYELPSLETLCLVNTNVSDADVEALCAMRNLRTLALAGSQVSCRGIDALASALPQCAIDMAEG